jgi:transcriptional antiterminator RfaH
MDHWYAVQTQARKDDLARLSLDRLGVETFAPTLREEKVVRGVRRTVVGPLFPGYLFARFDLGAHFRAVHYARGVRGLVTVVDEPVIAGIRARLEAGCVRAPRRVPAPGAPVRIEDGPLHGLDAVFDRELSGETRVVILLRALAYQARVVVPREHVVSL